MCCSQCELRFDSGQGNTRKARAQSGACSVPASPSSPAALLQLVQLACLGRRTVRMGTPPPLFFPPDARDAQASPTD